VSTTETLPRPASRRRTRALVLALAAGFATWIATEDARGNGGDPPPRPDPSAAPAPDAGTAPVGGGLEVGPFSSNGGTLPPGWEPLVFKNIPNHTRYTIEQSERGWVVRAKSDAAASGLIRRLPIDLRKFPILTWSWKVDQLIAKSDPTAKSGDDYAARIYIAFRYEPERVGLFRKAKFKTAQLIFGDIPYGAINYIWATRTPLGSILDNPYAGDFVKMIPVQSGAEQTGRWREEKRNVYEDYKRAYGDEPPLVDGVAIMTDTDNTGESATAWYGDIRFLPAEPE
jgi:hypothetical protein